MSTTISPLVSDVVCSAVRLRLLDYVAGGELPNDLAEHVRGCRACELEHKTNQLVGGLLGTVSDVSPSAATVRRLRAPEVYAGAASGAQTPMPAARPLPRAIGIVVAIVLLAIGGQALLQRYTIETGSQAGRRPPAPGHGAGISSTSTPTPTATPIPTPIPTPMPSAPPAARATAARVQQGASPHGEMTAPGAADSSRAPGAVAPTSYGFGLGRDGGGSGSLPLPPPGGTDKHPPGSVHSESASND